MRPAAGTVRPQRTRSTCRDRPSRRRSTDSQVTVSCFEFTVGTGLSSARDIAAITVNRWPHGYSYVANSLFDSDDYESTVELARRPFGRIAIANSDAGGDAY